MKGQAFRRLAWLAAIWAASVSATYLVLAVLKAAMQML
ncbi:DUF2474 family protein [Marinobacter zhejiangensis]